MFQPRATACSYAARSQKCALGTVPVSVGVGGVPDCTVQEAPFAVAAHLPYRVTGKLDPLLKSYWELEYPVKQFLDHDPAKLLETSDTRSVSY